MAVDLVDEKYVIHSEIFRERLGREELQRAREISDEIDNAFRRKGVERLHTWAITDDQYRYNLFLGYTPTGNEVTHPNFDFKVYEFVKELGV